MSWPESEPDFRALVGAMRELGVLQAFGVTLGPEPTKLEKLERSAASDEDRAERDRLRKEERIASERERVRNLLAGTGKTYTVEQIDEYIDPAVFE